MSATTFALTAFLGLLYAGGVHLRHPSVLRQALAAHGVVPKPLIPSACWLVTSAEVAVGGTGVGATLLGADLTNALALAAAALLATFAAYTATLIVRGVNASCGCAASDYPVSTWVLVRAVAFTLAAVSAAAAPGVAAIADMTSSVAALVVIEGVALASLLWILPDALADPLEMPVVRAALGGR